MIEPSYQGSRSGQASAPLTAHRASIPALTGLRFFAAMYVVVFHSKVPDLLLLRGYSHAGYFFSNGVFAVQMFFLLSGFILAYTYRNQIKTSGQRRRFWEARYSRIWPLYAVSLLLASLVYHATPPWPIALATLLMVQAWNPFNQGMAGAWNFVCWTISTEALFYAFFPALQGWFEGRTRGTPRGVLISVLAVAIVCRTGARGLLYPQPHLLTWIPLAVERVPDFILGVCLGNLFLDHRNRQTSSSEPTKTRRYSPLTWVGAAASLWLLSHPEGWWTAFAVIGFVALLWGFATEQSLLARVLSSAPLRIGGQISYGVYLLQWPCKLFIYDWLDKRSLHSPLLHFAVDLLALLLLSAACFYGIEDPARKVLRNAFAKLERRRSAVAAS